MNDKQQIYFDDFASPDWDGRVGQEQMEYHFGMDPLDESITVLFASYTYEDYSGHAYVLYEQGGKLFEVCGNHCSCYGLEGQWEPDETTPEAALSFLAGSQYYVENPEAKAVLIARLEALKAAVEGA